MIAAALVCSDVEVDAAHALDSLFAVPAASVIEGWMMQVHGGGDLYEHDDEDSDDGGEMMMMMVMVMMMMMMMMILVVVVLIIHDALCVEVGVCVLVVLFGGQILAMMA